MFRYLVPAEFVVMFGWGVYQAIDVNDPQAWWHPFHPFSIVTCVAQWTFASILLLAFNRRVARASTSEP